MRPGLGFGVGLRPAHYRFILDQSPSIDWVEIVSENYLGLGGRPRLFLEQVRARYPVVMHGVGLSIAGSDPLNRRYLEGLKKLADEIEPRFVSDHLCWTSHRGANSHDLLPLAYNEEVLAHVALRVREVQDLIARPLYLENPSAYVSFAGSEMGEAEFLAELCARTGCGLLLDVNNLFVNSMNLGTDPTSYLDRLNPDSIAYFHLAGHSVLPAIRIDTHDAPIPDGVVELYRDAVRRFPKTPTLVEWDGDVPEFPVLMQEVEKARAAHREALASPAVHQPARVAATVRGPLRVPWTRLQDQFWTMATRQESVEATDLGLGILEHGLPARAMVGMNVYADAYHLRIVEAVQETYPTLTHVLGPKLFADVIRAYLKVEPSREVSIKFAAAGLSRYLKTCKLPKACRAPSALLADIAALDWAREEVFDAPDSPEALPLTVLGEVLPEDWEKIRFDFVQSLRIVATAHDISPVLAAAARDEAPEIPELRPTYYLVYRAELESTHEEISGDEAIALTSLAAGETFQEACARVTAFEGGSEEAIVSKVVAFLARWFELELVHGLRLK